MILEPQTTIYKWLFQLDDSQSLHRKWWFHQTSIYKWLFGVPGYASLFSMCTCLEHKWQMTLVLVQRNFVESSTDSRWIGGRDPIKSPATISFCLMCWTKNMGFFPQIIHLFIGFGTMIFTILFGVKHPYFWKHPYSLKKDMTFFFRVVIMTSPMFLWSLGFATIVFARHPETNSIFRTWKIGFHWNRLSFPFWGVFFGLFSGGELAVCLVVVFRGRVNCSLNVYSLLLGINACIVFHQQIGVWSFSPAEDCQKEGLSSKKQHPELLGQEKKQKGGWYYPSLHDRGISFKPHMEIPIKQPVSRWWFQRFFIFTPVWGRFPIWLRFYRWVETTTQSILRWDRVFFCRSGLTIDADGWGWGFCFEQRPFFFSGF